MTMTYTKNTLTWLQRRVSHKSYYSYKNELIRGSLNKFPDFSRIGTFIDSTHMKLLFEVISPGCNALVVSFQQLLEGLIEVFLCERVKNLLHSLFHLLSCLITTASGLREQPKVTRSKVWTIWRLRNCLDAHFGQIVCDKDGVVDGISCWTGALSGWKCHWPHLKSAGLFPMNLFLNFLKTST